MMARTIHIHLHRSTTADGEEEGHWVTMHGAHVLIASDGRILKGPKHLMGTKTREAQPREVKRIYHMTSVSAAMKILQSGHIKPVAEVSPELAQEAYQGEGGADYVYFGLSKQAALSNAVGEGVVLHVMGKTMVNRTLVDPESEGGIAMVRGPVPRGSIATLEFTSSKVANSPEGKALMRLFTSPH